MVQELSCWQTTSGQTNKQSYKQTLLKTIAPSLCKGGNNYNTLSSMLCVCCGRLSAWWALSVGPARARRSARSWHVCSDGDWVHVITAQRPRVWHGSYGGWCGAEGWGTSCHSAMYQGLEWLDDMSRESVESSTITIRSWTRVIILLDRSIYWCTPPVEAIINGTYLNTFHHVRAQRRIRKFITTDDTKNIATAIVGSRLDYCNSLLYGVSETNLNKLQRVQNSLARIVLGSDTRSSTMQNLADLHWLHVRARINSKIAFLTFKILTTVH